MLDAAVECVLSHYPAGHPGRDDKRRTIMDRYYWLGMSRKIDNYVKSCPICTAVKRGAPKPQAPLKARQVAVDLMRPYPKTSSRKTNILVVQGTFTKWVEAFPIEDTRTGLILKILEEEVFARFGYPQIIISDNSPQFQSYQWQRKCNRCGASAYFTARLYPRANPVERRNQEIKKRLRSRLLNKSHKLWAQQLPAFLRDLRMRRNAVPGYTSGEALLRYSLRVPGDWILRDNEVPEAPDHPNRKARMEEMRTNQLRYIQRYEGVEVEEPHQKGGRVMVRAHTLSDAARGIHAGFTPKWLGPYTIRQLHSGRAYTVDRDGELIRVSAHDV